MNRIVRPGSSAARGAEGRHLPRSPRIALLRSLSVGILVMLGAVAVTAQGPGRPTRDVLPNASRPLGPATIAGRVTAAESDAPLRQVLVGITNALGVAREVTTDDQGRYELADVPPGGWQMTFSRAGYITRKYGQLRPFGRAAQANLSPGQRLTIDTALTRSSAIIGRIYDEYGEPVTAAHVTALRPRMVRQKRYLEPVGGGDLTDDLGAFRLHSLPPGEYFVTASLRVAPPDSVVQTTLAPTFYPGTPTMAAAQKVRLAPGADAIIDFPLLPARTARVSGTILTSSGNPADAFLNLASESTEFGATGGGGGVTRDDGSFVIADIPPGTYTLVAELRSGASPATEVGAVSVTIDGIDVSGITVTTTKPGVLRGTIVVDAGVKQKVPSVVEIASKPRRAGAQGTFVTAMNGSFEMPAPPGPFTLSVDPPVGWAVKSTMIGGFDASDLAIDIGNEQDVPVTIVVTDRLTDLSGTVTGANGTRAYVVVFPADSANWTSRYIRSTLTDARGRFRILGLPPAQRYVAVAVPDLDEGEEEDPDFLQQMQKDGQTFDLAADELRTLDLKVLQPW